MRAVDEGQFDNSVLERTLWSSLARVSLSRLLKAFCLDPRRVRGGDGFGINRERLWATQRRGLTLIELLIALVILSGSMVVLGELTRQSLRDARDTQNLIQAELLAESLMTRFLIGELELLPVAERPLEDSEDSGAWDGATPRWLYSLDMNTIDEAGLWELVVTVREDRPLERRPTVFFLTRWMIDPEVENPPAEEAATTEDAAATATPM